MCNKINLLIYGLIQTDNFLYFENMHLYVLNKTSPTALYRNCFLRQLRVCNLKSKKCSEIGKIYFNGLFFPEQVISVYDVVQTYVWAKFHCEFSYLHCFKSRPLKLYSKIEKSLILKTCIDLYLILSTNANCKAYCCFILCCLESFFVSNLK